MSDPSPPPDRANAFRTLHEAVYLDLLRFAQRRTHTYLAEDAVAEAFFVLWRRFDEVPQNHDDARAWAFGVLRSIMLNTRRGEQRRQALGIRLANVPTEPYGDSHEDAVMIRIDLGRAWHLLSEVHQEALGLAVFEDLPAPQAAAVLSISPVAFRLRLSRSWTFDVRLFSRLILGRSLQSLELHEGRRVRLRPEQFSGARVIFAS